jgi:hypothetical protein
MSKVLAMRAGGALSPIYPQSIEEVYRLATMALKSGMLKPITKGWGEDAETESAEATLARGTMIIMQGMEIGVPPMQAVQLLAMINGRITAHSEAVPGLLLAHGIKLREWWSGTEMADDWTCHVELTRPDGEKHESTFSVKDAKQARLWDQREQITKKGKNNTTYNTANDSPWFKYPKRMLRARALGFGGKDFGADVLKGIQIKEEAEDMLRVEHSRDITPSPIAELPDIPDVPDIPDAVDEMPADDDVIADPAGFVEHYRDQYAEASDDERKEIIDSNADIVARLPDQYRREIANIISEAA